ncbi:60 kDa SS-A/Ro ribonucleoprotein-like [Limulus polyphemus]|uniref:60 kDa SS-A/Ro ribonucleoprotein-like n=1 Tax=Limulus polyphemus TaxID=6850 RepID=A0ABM1B512_LIMPO|nr:60 kDa SS-A/Ro ribonucleoprotein-like [Limulus polyphemus]
MAENIPNLGHSRLLRFLYIGSETNCYIPGDRKLTLENIHCIDSSSQEAAVKEIIRVAKEGSSVYPDALPFALAVCSQSQNMKVKQAAYSALKEACPTASELFSFVHFAEEVSKPTTGWGRSRRTAVANWYKTDPKRLAALITRVMSHRGWSHKDLFRLVHLKTENKGLAALYKYITHGYEAAEKEFGVADASPQVKDVLEYLKAVHELKHTADEQKAARLIEMHDLNFEHIPTPMLKSKEIWLCLIHRLPVQVLLSQLPRLHRLGFLKHKSPVLKPILERLNSDSTMNDGHLGPLQTFIIAKQLETLQKNPVDKTVLQTYSKLSQLDDTLQTLHLASFKMVPSTGKRYLVAVDVRNSMVHGKKTLGCRYVSPADAACLILMALSRAESGKVTALAFSKDGLKDIEINNKMTHNDFFRRLRETPMGPVNVAAPLQWAQEKKKTFDVILVCTANQIQSGDVHPADAFKEYRLNLKLPQARFIVCAFSSGEFSLAPPDEPGMLDIAGFSEKVLQVIQDFARGVF